MAPWRVLRLITLCRLLAVAMAVPFFGETDDDVLPESSFSPRSTTAAPAWHNDAKVLWSFDRWSACYATNCFDGVQQRKVWCTVISGGSQSEVDGRYCSTLPKPSETQTCVNAHVCTQQASRVAWRAGPWSACALRDALTKPPTCDQATGERRREVFCASVASQQRVPDEICERQFAGKPSAVDNCELNCTSDCVTTTFGPWTSCVRKLPTGNCLHRFQYRTKQVLAPANRGGKDCGNLAERRECDRKRYEQSVPYCDEASTSTQYQNKASSWANCEANNEPAEADFGGVGGLQKDLKGWLRVSKRQVSCVDANSSVVPASRCTAGLLHDLPQQKRLCLVSKSCQLSHWSSWSPVHEACADSAFRWSQTRKRSIVDLGSGTVDDCGELNERRSIVTHESDNDDAAFDHCSRIFAWKVTLFGNCELQNAAAHCGNGIKRRSVICVNLTDNVVVNEKYCVYLKKPVSVEQCTVECSVGCSLSIWSSWSDCLPSICSSSNSNQNEEHRVRSRQVLTQPSSDQPPCHHLAEFQSCSLQPCFRWKIVHRNRQCVLPHGKLCGTGKRPLREICINHLQVQVNASMCTEKPLEKEPCEVPCANDCVLSEWSDWSKCGDGERMRYRTVVKAARANGTDCVGALQESESCEELRAKHHWRSGPWSACVAMDGRCGSGRQTRLVDCVDDSGQSADPQQCQAGEPWAALAPPTRRDCLLPCTVQCDETPPSALRGRTMVCASLAWCPLLNKQLDWTELETRAQWVVPIDNEQVSLCEDGGTNAVSTCVSHSSSSSSSSSTSCQKHLWHSDGWSQCVTLPGSNCGSGVRLRRLTCILVNTSTSNNDYDMHVHSSERVGGQQTAVAQRCLDAHGPPDAAAASLARCQVACSRSEQCDYTPWSRWTSCTGRCTPSGRQRRVAALGPCEQPAKLVTFQLRQCPHCKPSLVLLAQEIGPWSACVLPVKVQCGQGTQFRRLVCMDVDGRPVPNVNCSLTQYAERSCYVPCARRCEYTPWSPWSPCSVSCINVRWLALLQQLTRSANASYGLPAFVGFQSRERLPVASNPYSLACSTARETRFCDATVECSEFRWLSTAWSACVLLSNRERDNVSSAADAVSCGIGIKSRTVKCYEYRGATVLGEVHDSRCNQTKPNEQELCELACHNECVMTQWSPWSRCNTPCLASHFRFRSRSVISSPQTSGSESDINCAHREESQPCEPGKACTEYVWRSAGWSSCVASTRITTVALPESNGLPAHAQRIDRDGMLCGDGLRKLDLNCVANGDRIVDWAWCVATSGMPNVSVVENCRIPCNIDCLVSPWSSWSACVVENSAIGFRKRQRTVMAKAEGNGFACPEEMEQAMPCSFIYEYRWEFSKWSSCTVEDAPATSTCGEGVRRRLYYCVIANGTRVSDVYCEMAAVPRPVDSQLVESCYKPCAADCVVTEWSSWSSCHRLCSQGLQNGLQTRSRAVLESASSLFAKQCPSDDELVETRPCNDGPCVKYHWSVSEWFEDERSVWCERNDGLVVEGGCSAPRPSGRRQCLECHVNNTFCSSSKAKCVCKSAFIPKYQGNTLVDCVANQSATTDSGEEELSSDEELESMSDDSWSTARSDLPKKEPATSVAVFGTWYSSGIIWYSVVGIGLLVVVLLLTAAFAMINHFRNLRSSRSRRSLQCNQMRQATRTSTTSIENQLTLLASQKSLDAEMNASSPMMTKELMSPGKRNGYIELEPLNPLNSFARC